LSISAIHLGGWYGKFVSPSKEGKKKRIEGEQNSINENGHSIPSKRRFGACASKRRVGRGRKARHQKKTSKKEGGEGNWATREGRYSFADHYLPLQRNYAKLSEKKSRRRKKRKGRNWKGEGDKRGPRQYERKEDRTRAEKECLPSSCFPSDSKASVGQKTSANEKGGGR